MLFSNAKIICLDKKKIEMMKTHLISGTAKCVQCVQCVAEMSFPSLI